MRKIMDCCKVTSTEMVNKVEIQKRYGNCYLCQSNINAIKNK